MPDAEAPLLRAEAADAPLLAVEDLHVRFRTDEGMAYPVRGVSFEVNPGEMLAIVGESGSGKSLTALAVLGLVPRPPGLVEGTAIRYAGRDLLGQPAAALRQIRGREIAMIFQEPMTSLNPMMTIGAQIAEAILLHEPAAAEAAHRRAVELLERVRIPDPARVAKRYPFQLSGGMRQRVMIAMALSCSPRIIIADEPTTALDVTTQAQILDLLRELRHELDMAVVLITHDLGVVAETADRVLVMYGGEIVEAASVDALFSRPRMPYTAALLRAVPLLVRDGGTRGQPLANITGSVPSVFLGRRGCGFAPRCAYVQAECVSDEQTLAVVDVGHRARCERATELDLSVATTADPALAPASAAPARDDAPPPAAAVAVRELTVEFEAVKGVLGFGRRSFKAVADVDFQITRGEVLALVGESGSGKTTLGRTILRLVEPTSGEVIIDGRDVRRLAPAEVRDFRRHAQMIFQDPASSLNGRMTVGEIVEEPLVIHGIGDRSARRARVDELLGLVGLDPNLVQRQPHEFSGGQRQRIGIARALAVEPAFIVADEPVSALDVSVQAQILNLLKDLRERLGLTILFIAHDLGVVDYIADRVAVMYLGRIVEVGTVDAVLDQPGHPYTEALLAAVPSPRPRQRRLHHVGGGEIPSPLAPPSGCAFRLRCALATAVCSGERPLLRRVASGRLVACHHK